jgi:hypothetical protein
MQYTSKDIGKIDKNAPLEKFQKQNKNCFFSCFHISNLILFQNYDIISMFSTYYKLNSKTFLQEES